MPTPDHPNPTPDPGPPPDDQALLAVLLHEAPPELVAAVDRARSESPEVQARLDRLSAVLADLAHAAPLADQFRTTAAQRNRLKDILRLAPAPADPVDLLRRAVDRVAEVIGELLFDSWATPAAQPGYRDATAPDAQRVLQYRFNAARLNLRITADAAVPDRWWLQCDSGDAPIHAAQLTPIQPAGPALNCELAGPGYAEACVDAGAYRLVLRTSAADLVIDRLFIGPPVDGPSA